MPQAPMSWSLRSLAPQATILALLGEYLESGETAWAGGIVRMFGDLGLSESSARISMNRIVARGLLSRIREGRRIYYSPTPRMRELMREGRRQTYYFQQPAGENEAWTLVWYAVPQEMRAPRRRLARRLSFLGFGLARDNLWVIPRDRGEEAQRIVDDLDIGEFVDVYLFDPGRGPRPAGPLMATWDLDHIDELYRVFLGDFAPLAKRRVVGKLSERQAFVARTHLIDAFHELASLDPRLPGHVIDRPWLRDDAIALFTAANAILEPRARQHFAKANNPSVTTSWT
jgi:phenylacetic acid degradation operon negative regulatory protein